MDYNNTQLYSYDTKKKVRVWKAYSDFVLNDDGHVVITIEHGQENGKIQKKVRKVKDGKNKNKANETTIEQQASLEIGYLYRQQLEDGYVLDINNWKELYRPILAHKYKDKKHTIKWTNNSQVHPKDRYYASRKLNGIRCFIFIEDGKVTKFVSRSGKEFKYFHHLADDILKNYKFKNVILDGELFHDKIPFEMICSLVNSDDYKSMEDEATKLQWASSDIQFNCYDIVDTEDLNKCFYDRFIANNWYNSESTYIKYVESVPIENEAEMIALATKWIAEGFEGLMIRFGGGIYEFDKRSIYLIKYKVMEQEEFLIWDMYIADNDDSIVIYTMQNHHNTEDEEYKYFDCTLQGNKVDNLKYFKEKHLHIKKSWMTIDYQALSAYRVPLFITGLAIRPGEVVDGKFVPSV